MSSVTVTEEAVAKLNEYSSIIRESNAEIKEECDSLARIFDENKESGSNSGLMYTFNTKNRKNDSPFFRFFNSALFVLIKYYIRLRPPAL